MSEETKKLERMIQGFASQVNDPEFAKLLSKRLDYAQISAERAGIEFAQVLLADFGIKHDPVVKAVGSRRDETSEHLSRNDRNQIRLLHRDGLSVAEIRLRTGRCETTIRRVIAQPEPVVSVPDDSQ
jgi:Helix-turn-helix domain